MNAAMLEPIPVKAVRTVWPLIRSRLENLQTRFNETWVPEDIFHEILSGNAYLWTTPLAVGFVVLQIHSSPYERDLHVWIACNSTQAHAGEFMPQLVEIAADHQCNRVTWESGRKGWDRAVPSASVRYLYSVPVGGQDGQHEKNHD
jgi:hypothetical protein